MLEAYVILLLIVTTLLVFHGTLSLWQMLKGWSNSEIMKDNKMPRENTEPKILFSIIIPARHEETVIKDTLRQLLKQTYPKDKIEILVPMTQDDLGTIREVEKVIAESHERINIKPVIFSNGLINSKPHALNVALRFAKGDYIVVFDAEDHIHPNLLAATNTIIKQEGRKIIQTGVNLVNWNSNWFCLHTALEYYFWFRSRIHWYAANGLIILGGVGVFIPKEILINLNGWDESCLTEDAKLGIDCSVRNYPFRVVSDEEYAVLEEVPKHLSTFVRQRTRWIQGYMQIVSNMNWRNLPIKTQLYFLSLFLFPVIQILLYAWLVITFSLFVTIHLPIGIVMFAFLPLAILFFQIVVLISGSIEMLKTRKQIHLIPIALLSFVLTYIPYQLLISFCAMRAITRSFNKNFNWEKTKHLNAHRDSNSTVLFQEPI